MSQQGSLPYPHNHGTKMHMIKLRQVFGLIVVFALVLWALTAPVWFASGKLGRALTDLDIWAQIHLPYPVLTLLLMGIIGSCAIIWVRRHSHEEDGGTWNHRR